VPSFTRWRGGRQAKKEPARTKAALAHLEAGIAQVKAMWIFILAETDDDNEWIPNPKQNGVIGIPVTQAMVDAWQETLDAAEQVLQAKKLIPLWRGKEERGVKTCAACSSRRGPSTRKYYFLHAEGARALFRVLTG
jgi:hypothetical protein